jgi:hypothetical protein
MMIMWSLYRDGDGDGTQAKNYYVALKFKFQDL